MCSQDSPQSVSIHGTLNTLGVEEILWKLTTIVKGPVKSTETRHEWKHRRLPYYKKLKYQETLEVYSTSCNCNSFRVVYPYHGFCV